MMEEMTAGTRPTLLNRQIKHFLAFLHSAIGCFRIGEDAEGMENFLSAMEELELVVKTDRNSPYPKIDLNLLLPSVRGLYFYMQNQDITGIADLLEDAVAPLAENWLKEAGDT
ncbi:hypothetical protein [Caproiciproducens sp. NJN-50]|uniref:hypothetical protein n=1 Tax=Caproiciproducens sp. NJN-50 TaxID=2507162 RepID=UPI0013E8CB84|nr:hypothetical protein [Caproiciproducens sp. NJN-50]